MKRSLFFALFWLSSMTVGIAQSNADLIQVVDRFFVAMEAKDTVVLDSIMHDECILFSTLTRNGVPIIEPLRKASFLGFMGRAIQKKYVYDEQLWSYEVSREDNLATVWTEYTLFTGKENTVSHCGVNIFTLAKNKAQKWVITNITDTRRKTDCIEEKTPLENKDLINQLLNDWHQASTTANADAFFGAMTADCIYLGTDASERWLRDELRTWANFAFERDTAWAFTPSKREIYFSDNQKIAWFEEMLATQMGTCRASGVLCKVDGTWKIKHYDLAIMVPNDLIKDFMKLVEMGGLPEKKKRTRKKKKKS
ncbi:nuclear transport factor 2 family protein [Aureispira anguillae]|uniref:Nuclear transport factor 2 family protein n=1 Tax=Aureispira anguillae TaxID=2864201 RepID=A0A915Y9S0_9BACT|nr:nuclear transport factor 2 family protein [Aureispira anguillae]BDS09743.1 nuclear transport factor 2 family protein [Aureispira anguillae]